MSQQYGVPVGSSVNVMSGPGGAGGSMPGSGGGGHNGPGTYSGPNMQYHQGETSADCRLNINLLYIYICVVTQTRDEEVNFIYINLNYKSSYLPQAVSQSVQHVTPSVLRPPMINALNVF